MTDRAKLERCLDHEDAFAKVIYLAHPSHNLAFEQE